jgi:hypothetical protein
MILTEIFVVMCASIGVHCFNYVDVVPGILSAPACERAIQEVAREHAEPYAMLQPGRSSCSQIFVNSRDDLDS